VKTLAAVGLLLAVAPLSAQTASEIVVTTPAGTPHEMVLVAAGECTIGAGPGRDALPLQQVYLPAFYVDKYEVTNGRYQAFLQVAGRPTPEEWTQYPEVAQPDSPDYPAIGIRWSDAVAYCQWAGLRLPTNLEWEKAARGTDGRTYPWGEGVDSTRANHGWLGGGDVCCFPDPSDGYLHTSPVGSYPAGVSPYGAHDMAGNVAEWTADPYHPEESASGSRRCIRGGSYQRLWHELATYAIAGSWEDRTDQWWIDDTGFRCVCDPSSSAVPASAWAEVKDDVRD
jgi:formylglycine-generating enzyme required for sulfatase activity